MKLLLKVNIVLVIMLLVGMAVSYEVVHRLLQENARSEVTDNARIMMESALAVRTYTNHQISPLLQNQMRYRFLPQAVAAYSAKEYFTNLRQKFSDYSYREATLNPTNPDDRASDWEAELVHYFRDNPNATEWIAERDTAIGRTLYLARPLRIVDGACLQCHSSVDAAPATMIDKYGTANGFGWQLKDVVGAQIVSVPYDLPLKRANAALKSFVYLLVGVYLFMFLAVNVLMTTLVVRPVRKLAVIADQVSLGHLDAPALSVKGGDEIATLGLSFNRLRITVTKALEALKALGARRPQG
jgi:HAMP domain-containing protein